MDANLREHFDRAVTDDPGADPGEMARTSIAQGGLVHRRRTRLATAAGVLAVLAVAAGVTLRPGATGSADPQPAAPAMVLVAAPSCSVDPVRSGATDVVIMLANASTGRQQSALSSALADDARVGTVRFESRAQAYQRFRERWAKNPDFVASVSADELPEWFGLRLVDASQYPAFRADYASKPGVQDVFGRICPTSAPVGGVK